MLSMGKVIRVVFMALFLLYPGDLHRRTISRKRAIYCALLHGPISISSIEDISEGEMRQG